MILDLARDPYRRSVALAGAFVVGGFAAIGAGWYGVSDTLIVPTQVAFAVSGGIGGFALAGAGLALLEVQRRRHAAALDRDAFASFAGELGDLAELIARRATGTPRTRVPASTSTGRRRRAPLRAR